MTLRSYIIPALLGAATGLAMCLGACLTLAMKGTP